MKDVLIVVVDHRIMGEIQRDQRDRLVFIYDESWRTSAESYPLSLSMPLVEAEHPHDSIEPWLWGLLPDNEIVLDRWGRRHQVSSGSAFALLGAVGEDCPGAIQLVRQEKVESVLRQDKPQVEWLTEAEVAGRLHELGTDQSAWRASQDTGQFSLPGAQPKTALYFDGQRWGVPHGSTPTTHILKPPLKAFEGHSENEHLCLRLARALGLPTTASEVLKFGDEIAIVVERYDRARETDRVRRIHQEDLCQIAGLPPTKKYQNDGGPTCSDMADAVRTHSTAPLEDVWTLARATMLNWIIGGTDAHSKNFSMLIGRGGEARLAPLYDVASFLPYENNHGKLKLANKIGSKYRINDIRARHWTRFASEVRLPAAEVLDMGLSLSADLPTALAETVADARDNGLDHQVIEQMVEILDVRSKRCSDILADDNL